ncbi:hypothetical protein RI845_07465 [Thalassotalea nanhaiensis]|uniref:Uncharacterized protein n=1 Tax=Thalassotalea nanhaiensis TaxID=3065648 RepID=A0ABY9TNI5_9GAMM|nr:hypothetical protein RI845_07465 [Colwelliaceae bacterium SQ345]
MSLKIFSFLRTLTNSPTVNVLIGLIILATSLAEIISSVDRISIGAHHGAAIFGLFHTLKSLPELVEGIKKFEE